MGNVGDKDIVYCLNIGDGKEVWRYEYDCRLGSYPGPRATPAIEEGVLYAHSREGHVLCLDAETGAAKWQKNVVGEYGAGILRWGLASSPVIEGDMLLLNAGKHCTALAKATGEKIWSGGPGKGNYSSVVVYEREAGKGIAVFGEAHIYGLDFASGKELWSHPWQTAYNINAADPIVHGNRVFISSGYDRGCALLEIEDGRPSVAWENKSMRNHFSSSVLLDGHLYGIDGNTGSGSLRCLEFETGKVVWSQELGFGSLMIADGKIIVLNERGKLFIAEAAPEGYKEISSADTGLSPRCWTSPVLCRGRIFCRNSEGALIAVDVR
jgi:outer membrane protein assembly factor BamB